MEQKRGAHWKSLLAVSQNHEANFQYPQPFIYGKTVIQRVLLMHRAGRESPLHTQKGLQALLSSL